MNRGIWLSEYHLVLLYLFLSEFQITYWDMKDEIKPISIIGSLNGNSPSKIKEKPPTASKATAKALMNFQNVNEIINSSILFLLHKSALLVKV